MVIMSVHMIYIINIIVAIHGYYECKHDLHNKYSSSHCYYEF